MTKYEITAEVTKILEAGTCPREHKIGDVFRYFDDMDKLCPPAFHALYPYIRVMEQGGEIPGSEPGSDYGYFCCPDYKNPVVFKLTRTEIPE